MNFTSSYEKLTKEEREFLVEFLNHVKNWEGRNPPHKPMCNYPKIHMNFLWMMDKDTVDGVLKEWLIHPNNAVWGKYHVLHREILRKLNLKPVTKTGTDILDTDVNKHYEDMR